MRTTVTIDDDLLAKAKEYTGVEETSVLVRKGIESLMQREAARRLAKLGGTMPDLKYIPRRRPPGYLNEAPELIERVPELRPKRRKTAK